MKRPKAVTPELEQELAIALKEIGPIEPQWSDEDEMFIFEHDAYPMVMYADADKETTIEGYKRVLADFIKDRLNDNVADFVDEMTSGRGGARKGAGRKKKEVPTTRVRIPTDIAAWLGEDTNLDKVRDLMKA